jgi:hypothetical protein
MLAPSRKLTNSKPITAHHARPRGDLPNPFAVTASTREPSHPGGTNRMPATTVDAATDTEREPDVATAAEKSAVTLNYEAMLAALNDLLAEIREERRQAEASGNVVDAQHGQEQATTQPNVWVEAHAALSRI